MLIVTSIQIPTDLPCKTPFGEMKFCSLWRYVSTEVLNAAFADSGLVLDYYKSYLVVCSVEFVCWGDFKATKTNT